jgi:DNA (cytosine-5)-methyltransferase 1
MDGVYFAPTKHAVGGLTCIDVFSGAGGMADGFRQAGFRIMSGTDQAGAACSTFRLNFPEASFFRCPISELSGEELLEDAGLEQGDLDCLIGGPPCQAFSYNNHAREEHAAQSTLFRDYLRIVEALQPKCVVMENVPGILTILDGAVMETIYTELQALGYECGARILYSEDYGVPQERRRVFFIASRLGPVEGLFPRGRFGPAPKPSREANPLVHRWSLRPGQEPRSAPTVWCAIGDLPAVENGGGTDKARHTKAPACWYQVRMRQRRRRIYNHVAPALRPVQIHRIRHVPEGGNWRDIPFDLLPAGMQRAKPSDHTKRYGRLSKQGLCCTILTKCDPHWGSYVHPDQDRAISVREAARLQSFTDRFRFAGYRSEQFALVGNAVPPLLAVAIGRRIRRHLQVKCLTG